MGNHPGWMRPPRSRYIEELKDLDRELRRAMKEESPTFERIRFFVAAPGEDGEPWLRLPRTFFLEDSREYFQTDIIPRHNRLLSRACWQVALDHRPKEKKGARYLCWDHLCHRGCGRPSSCPHSHGTAPKWEHLDWAVQLQMLRRGGLRSQPKFSESQVAERMADGKYPQSTTGQEPGNGE